MGLDLSHNAWNWSYSGFMTFRKHLAAQIGIDLEEYFGYNKDWKKNLRSIKHKIRPLLNHSDCDGYLTPKQAKMVAEWLDEILNNFDESKTYRIHWTFRTNSHLYSDFKEEIIQLRDWCLDAVSKNQRIIFS